MPQCPRKQVKSCKTIVEPKATVLIEPFDRMRVIRDLAVVFKGGAMVIEPVVLSPAGNHKGI